MKSSSKKFSLLIVFALILLLLSTITSAMHWDANKILEKIALVFLGCVYFIRFLHKSDKNLLDLTKLGLISGYIFHRFLMLYHVESAKFFLWILVLITVFWITLEVIGKLSNRFGQLHTLSYIGMGIVMLEVLFKIKHWPLSFLFQVVGLVLLLCSFGIEFYNSKILKQSVNRKYECNFRNKKTVK